MILERLLARIAPHECLGCGTEGNVLCRVCMSDIPHLPARCYRCRKLSDDSKTCPTCRHHSALFRIRARTAYDGLAKELVWRLKFSSARAAAREMADELSSFVPREANVILVPVPTATSRSRQRGYDQSQLIAKALARRTNMPYVHCLRRLGQHHQVGSTRQQRIDQLRSAYRCVNPDLLRDAYVVLIDDVLTTGATLEAAASVILASGAKRVGGLVFAQA